MFKNYFLLCDGICTFLLVSFLALGNGSGLATEVKDKTDMQDSLAKEAAERFMKALGGEDVEPVLKTVDVPFFFKGRGYIGNIKDRQELKKNLESMLSPGFPVEFKVGGIYSFGSLPENVFSNNDYKMLKEILQKSDRIVLLQLPRRVFAIPVAARAGEAKVVGVVPVGLLSLALIAEQKEKTDKNAVQAMKVAKETVEHFLKTAKAKDLDSLMKLADVPWYSDGTNIIKDRDKMKELLKSDWVDFANHARFPSQVLGIMRVGEFSQHLGKERLRPDEVLATNDWVVLVGQNGKEKGMLFVAVREGKGKVLGAAS